MKHTFRVIGLVLVLCLAGVSVLQAQDEGTIVDLAVGNEDLSTLVTAVQEAGLVDVLSDPDAQWTVFAPTNEAFAALPAGVLDMLLADQALLTRVLTYHVVEGAITSDMLTDMMAPSMEMTAPGADLMGSELMVEVGDDGSVMVNDATVLIADVIASNGVVHVIDKVLVPADIAAMLQGEMTSEPMMMDFTVAASLNPAELGDDAIVTLSSDLAETMNNFNGFEGIASVQSVAFTSDGTAYVTVDVAEGEGGIVVVEGMGGADSMMVGMGTRMIGGTANAGLIAPKGLDIVDHSTWCWSPTLARTTSRVSA